MTVAVPAVIPVMAPAEPTDILVLPLCHVPPGVMLLSVVVPPSHNTAVPVIAVGAALTVTVTFTVQPDPNE